MQTIKTGIVVALLLAVCYGAFVALNAPDPDLPASVEEWASGEQDVEQLVGFEMGSELRSLDSATAVSAEQMYANLQGAESSPTLGAADLNPASIGGIEPGMLGMPPAANSGGNSTLGLPSMPSLPTGQNIGSFPSLGSTATGTPSADNTSAGTFPLAGNLGHPSQSPLGVQVGESKNVAGQMVAHSETDSSSLIPPLLGEDPLLAAPTVGSTTHPTLSTETTLPVLEFSLAREQALNKANAGELKEALKLLSAYYGSPELGYEEHSDLLDILDPLSQEVIYSKQHHLEPAYTASQTDTVASVAKAFNINAELLSAINQLGTSKALVPGSKLKVIQGPFRSRVDLARKELTIFLGDVYAGRFPISIGNDPSPQEGTFEVVDRQTDRVYYGVGTVVLTANNPMNPFGGYWINLGNHLCIHGTAERPSNDLKDAGCISLAPLDAKHVYSILGAGSQVEIRK